MPTLAWFLLGFYVRVALKPDWSLVIQQQVFWFCALVRIESGKEFNTGVLFCPETHPLPPWSTWSTWSISAFKVPYTESVEASSHGLSPAGTRWSNPTLPGALRITRLPWWLPRSPWKGLPNALAVEPNAWLRPSRYSSARM